MRKSRKPKISYVPFNPVPLPGFKLPKYESIKTEKEFQNYLDSVRNDMILERLRKL